MPRYIADDGTRIAFETFGAAGSHPPVILQHGFLVNGHRQWVETGVVDALLKADRHLVVVDARAHGSSDKPTDPARLGEARMARDISGLADHLAIGQFDLVGYSMGSVISLLVASADRRVRRLVVGGVGEGIVEFGGLDQRAFPAETIAEALLAEDMSRVPANAAVFRTLADSLGGDRAALAAQARTLHSAPIALDAISAPTLVLVGHADPLAAAPHRLADSIPNARLKVLEGDHRTATLNPDFCAELVRWLKRGTKPKPMRRGGHGSAKQP